MHHGTQNVKHVPPTHIADIQTVAGTCRCPELFAQKATSKHKAGVHFDAINSLRHFCESKTN